MLERVIQNLVENALKYTPDGGLVQLELEQKAQVIRVVVLNSTGSIPELIWAYLEENTTVRPPNVGLGLTIVRKILTLHQTHLTVERRADQSLWCSFNLPVFVAPDSNL